MKIPQWLQAIPTNKPSQPIAANANIRIVGDRGSGKTAYMAALAYNPRKSYYDGPVKSVTTVGERTAGEELIKNAQDILEQGLELEATKTDKSSVSEVKDYGLQIILKDKFSWDKSNFGSHPIQLRVNCKDYAGEFFNDLIDKPHDPWLLDYFQDCLVATGILFLVDGTSHLRDNDYDKGLLNFFMKLSRSGGQEHQNRRIAFVLSKCELSQLWVSRDNPKQLVQNLFPKTFRQLENWAEGKSQTRQIDYFTSSAFGSLPGEYPEPNTKILSRDRGGYSCVIQEPRNWQPFGLVAPIYWLASGHRYKELDRD